MDHFLDAIVAQEARGAALAGFLGAVALKRIAFAAHHFRHWLVVVGHVVSVLAIFGVGTDIVIHDIRCVGRLGFAGSIGVHDQRYFGDFTIHRQQYRRRLGFWRCDVRNRRGRNRGIAKLGFAIGQFAEFGLAARRDRGRARPFATPAATTALRYAGWLGGNRLGWGCDIRLVVLGVLGLGLGAGFLGLHRQQPLPVSDRDLVIVRVDFAKGEEPVPAAAIFHKGGLQRRLHPHHFGEVDVAL